VVWRLASKVQPAVFGTSACLIAEMEIAMRRLIGPPRTGFLIVLIAAVPLLALAACSDALLAELQQDEQAYHNSIAQLSEDEDAGNATAAAADKHHVKLASTKLRYDRGIVSGPNEREHQEKEGHPR
jgi:hypothetical protein